MNPGSAPPDPAPDLAAIFLAERGESSGPEATPLELDRALHDAWQRGRAAWPDIPLPAEAFARHLALVVPAPEEPLAPLAAMNAVDVYLACACLNRIPRAISAFEAQYLSRTPALLARLSLTETQVQEVQQLLRERLFVAAPGATPKIASYSGRSGLIAWFRVVAMRTALNLTRGESKGKDDASLDALAANADLELDHIRAQYQEEFSRALKDGFAALSSKQRNLLRLRFLEGLTDEKIGRMFGVHQTTATRWIAAAREAVFAETRRLLRERLHLSTGEFESLILAVRSQLDVSITSLFRTNPARS